VKLTRVLHDIYQTWQPKPWPPVKPHVIQFPVNDICNAGCQMCHIWKQKLDYQISPEELDTALNNPLYSDVRTVGVNGGEPTLRKDLPELVEILFRRMPSLETISLITNGFVPKKVIERVGETGEVIKRFSGKFDVMVSLDGVGEVHDIVRGRPGNFEKALKVMDYLESTDLVTNIRLGCTVIKSNIYGLHDLLDFAKQRGLYIKYRLGIPHQRLYTHLSGKFDQAL
jgi:MoaA/NifB/PqqE/SkfB family radical SAM enzyme